MHSQFLRHTHRILEITDPSDYGGLSDANKEAYKMILSCGLVNLESDSPTRIKLWNIFPEGTTTGDALRDVSNGLVIPDDLPEV